VGTPSSGAIRERDRNRLLHSLHDSNAQATATVWVQGDGAILRDADGREYIDALSGLWNVFVGHGRRELADAAARQMQSMAYMSGYVGNTCLPAVELAERLSRITYDTTRTFYFASGGAEANEAAFKTARYYWKSAGAPNKTKIISRRWAYHGTTLATMSATGMDWYWPMFEPRVPGFVQVDAPYALWHESPGTTDSQARLASCAKHAAESLEAAIVREGPDTVAAFIAEPVQGAGGVIVPPDEYFRLVREVCDRHDILFIADEVITGFGRTGRWFALDHWGVKPDILSFAKAITSGYVPLGGIAVSDRIAEAIRSGAGKTKWMHAYTYSGHPTACAVALANLDIIEREDLVQRASELGGRLLRGLKQLESNSHVGEARGLGLMAAVEIVESKQPLKRFDPALGVAGRVLAEMARRGIVTRIVGDVILLAPPAIATESQIDRIVQVVHECIGECIRYERG
jgi:adenosylmethionine-8-amino-7-oxononanoate aminotransferase